MVSKYDTYSSLKEDEASFEVLLEDLLGPDTTPAQQMEGSIKAQHIDIKMPNTDSKFAAPVSFADIKELHEGQISKNTKRNTKWGGKVWNACKNNRLKMKPEEKIPDFKDMTHAQMNDSMCCYIMEVKNKSGEDYTPLTLHNLMCARLHYFRENGILDKTSLMKRYEVCRISKHIEFSNE